MILIALGVFFFLRRRSRHGIDRIHRVRLGAVSKDEILSEDPEPFTMIEPFEAGRPGDVNERSPLSPSTNQANALNYPFSTSSFDGSSTQLYARSEFGVLSETQSKWVVTLHVFVWYYLY